MKTDKKINAIIKQELENYAKAETKSEVADIKFSKEHEEKMKNMFNEIKKNTKKQDDDRELVIRIKFNLLTKVAIALIMFAVFASAISTGLKAWKEHKLESYGGNDEYSWLLSNDTSEIYEQKTTEEAVQYVKSIFEGISGDITDIEMKNSTKIQRLEFEYKGTDIAFKIRKDINIGINIEDEILEEIKLKDKVIYYSKHDIENDFRWSDDVFSFDLIGEIEVQDAIKIISEIKYEKIETNF